MIFRRPPCHAWPSSGLGTIRLVPVPTDGAISPRIPPKLAPPERARGSLPYEFAQYFGEGSVVS